MAILPRALVALLLTACGGYGLPNLDGCRLTDSGQLDIDWRDGETCRMYCAARPFFVSHTATEDVAGNCGGWTCSAFYADQDADVQLWRDPLAQPTGEIDADEWWTEDCEDFAREHPGGTP